jgi:hypothetical protein
MYYASQRGKNLKKEARIESGRFQKAHIQTRNRKRDCPNGNG